MSCKSSETDADPGSGLVLECNEPSIGKVVELRKRAIERNGGLAWHCELGPYLWERRRQEKCPIPSLLSIEWLIRTALPLKLSTKGRRRSRIGWAGVSAYSDDLDEMGVVG